MRFLNLSIIIDALKIHSVRCKLFLRTAQLANDGNDWDRIFDATTTRQSVNLQCKWLFVTNAPKEVQHGATKFGQSCGLVSYGNVCEFARACRSHGGMVVQLSLHATDMYGHSKKNNSTRL